MQLRLNCSVYHLKRSHYLIVLSMIFLTMSFFPFTAFRTFEINPVFKTSVTELVLHWAALQNQWS